MHNRRWALAAVAGAWMVGAACGPEDARSVDADALGASDSAPAVETASSAETTVASEPDAAPGETTAPPARTIAVYLSAGPSTAAGARAAGPTCTSTDDCNAGQACDHAQSPARCVTPADAWATACNADSVQSCKLYRVALDLDTRAIASVALVFDPTTDLAPANASASFMFPALAPADDRIAFEYRAGHGTGQVEVCALTDAGTHLGACGAVSLGTANDRGRWPSWRDARTLDFALAATGFATT